MSMGGSGWQGGRGWWLALVVLLAAGLAAWFLVQRGDGPAAPGDVAAGHAQGTAERVEGAEAIAGESAGGLAAAAVPVPALWAEPAGDLVLEGQVLTPDGLPAAGATVSLRLLLSPGERIAQTGPDGAFSFDRLVPGTVRLGARLGGLAGGPVLHQLDEKSDPAVIRLRPARAVHVEVVAALDGRPVPGARVLLTSVPRREARTGPDGLVRFEGAAGGFCELLVEAQGLASARQMLRVPEGAGVSVEVRVALAGGASLSGVVLSTEGAPVSGAKVAAADATQARIPDPQQEGGAVSDAQGCFDFPAVPAGTYRLYGGHPDHLQGMVGPIRVDGARPLAGIELRLGAAGMVRGRVVGPDGRPGAFSQVVAVPPEGNPKRLAGRGGGASYVFGYADRNGAFELRGVPREAVSLAAVTREAVSEEVVVDLGPTPLVEGVELRLGAAERIAGKVVDSRGAAAAEVMVTAVANSEDGTAEKSLSRSRMRQVMTDGGGGFSFDGLVAGTYSLWTSRYAGRVDFDRQAAVDARTGDLDVHLVLAGDSGLEGRVSFSDGTHPARFEVTVGMGAAVPFAPADGRFVLEHLPPGVFPVAVSGSGFASRALGEVKLEADRTKDLGEILVDRGRRVVGRVVDADGRPVEAALVVFGTSLGGDGSRLYSPDLMDEDVNLRLARSDGDGRFELAGIGAETGVVSAEHERFGRSQPAKVPAGSEDARVELKLQTMGSLEGLVRLNGTPAGGCQITLGVNGSGHHLVGSTGPDGTYLFARVPAATLQVDASCARGSVDFARQEITVGPGESAHLDFDLQQGEVGLEVQIQPLPGAQVDEALVYVLEGRAQVATVGEMKAAFKVSSGRKMGNLCRLAVPCFFNGLAAGDFTICGIPFFHDASGVEKGNQNDARRVTCLTHTLASTPALQGVVLRLPSMEVMSKPSGG
jgi:hypothetical protein